MRIKIKKLKPEAHLPSYVHPGDAGMDVYALEDKVIDPGKRHLFYLGFAMEFEIGYAAVVKDRGSMAKNGLHTLGGVFDAGFRGEYNIMLVNLGSEAYQVKKGDRIAQLIIYPVVIAELEEVAELAPSARDKGQFGSTGK